MNLHTIKNPIMNASLSSHVITDESGQLRDQLVKVGYYTVPHKGDIFTSVSIFAHSNCDQHALAALRFSINGVTINQESKKEIVDEPCDLIVNVFRWTGQMELTTEPKAPAVIRMEYDGSSVPDFAISSIVIEYAYIRHADRLFRLQEFPTQFFRPEGDRQVVLHAVSTYADIVPASSARVVETHDYDLSATEQALLKKLEAQIADLKELRWKRLRRKVVREVIETTPEIVSQDGKFKAHVRELAGEHFGTVFDVVITGKDDMPVADYRYQEYFNIKRCLYFNHQTVYKSAWIDAETFGVFIGPEYGSRTFGSVIAWSPGKGWTKDDSRYTDHWQETTRLAHARPEPQKMSGETSEVPTAS